MPPLSTSACTRSGSGLVTSGPSGQLPDGSFVLREGEPWLVHGAELLRWTPAGYTERRARSSGRLPVVTPPMLVEVLRAGWGGGSVPFLHPSAG